MHIHIFFFWSIYELNVYEEMYLQFLAKCHVKTAVRMYIRILGKPQKKVFFSGQTTKLWV